jgi:predicted membrane-bound spermidine synthase
VSVEIVTSLEERGQTVVLRRRGAHFDVVLGSVVLLSSAALETEFVFGTLAASQPVPPSTPSQAPRAPRRILVGGLGFGATARGALSVLAPGGRVIVVEKLQAIASFLRGPAAHLAEGVLEDPRVDLVHDDVADVIARETDLDAILLDVDNGPEWASFRTNARLYGEAGLAEARRALAPGGVYAVWSGYPADAFLPRLRHAKLKAEVIPLRENGVVRARAYVGRCPETTA